MATLLLPPAARRTERLRRVRRARPAIEAGIQKVVAQQFQWLWLRLYPRLRRLHHENRLHKATAAIISSSDMWLAFDARLRERLLGELQSGALTLGQIDAAWYVLHGKSYNVNPNAIVATHQADIGSKVHDITATTRSQVAAAVKFWYKVPGAKMSNLLDSLRPVFGDARARRIAINETTALASSVTFDSMQQLGVHEWDWQTMLDEVVCTTALVGPDGNQWAGCKALHGNTFKTTQPMPPNGSHIGCRCTALPKVGADTVDSAVPVPAKVYMPDPTSPNLLEELPLPNPDEYEPLPELPPSSTSIAEQPFDESKIETFQLEEEPIVLPAKPVEPEPLPAEPVEPPAPEAPAPVEPATKPAKPGKVVPPDAPTTTLKVTSSDDADAYLKEHFKPWTDEVRTKPDELNAVQSYKGTGYADWNRSLRSAKKKGPADFSSWFNQTDSLDAALARDSAAIPEPMTVYRNGRLPAMSPGKVFTDYGYISTSLNPDIRMGDGHFMSIVLPEGTHAGSIDPWGAHEWELLLPRGGRFRYLGTEYDSSIGREVDRLLYLGSWDGPQLAKLLAAWLAKGGNNEPGHPFHGNQYTDPDGPAQEHQKATRFDGWEKGAMQHWGEKQMGGHYLNEEFTDNTDYNSLSSYKEDGFVDINENLRHGDGSHEDVAGIDNAMSRHVTHEPVIAWRAGFIPDALQPGMQFDDKGFVSTTLSPQYAAKAARDGKGLALIEVHVPAGTHALYMDHPDIVYMGEYELLLHRNARFEYVKQRQQAIIGENFTVFELRLLPSTLSKAGNNEPGHPFRGNQYSNPDGPAQADAPAAQPFHYDDEISPGLDEHNRLRRSAGEQWGDQHFAEWGDKLTVEQAGELEHYKGIGFDSMNRTLRKHPSAESNPVFSARLHQLDSAIAQGAVPEDVTVYRLGHLPHDLTPGTTFDDKAYVSTSLSPRGAASFAKTAEQPLIEVHVPKGSHAAWMEHKRIAGNTTSEHELLLPRGSRFVIEPGEYDKHLRMKNPHPEYGGGEWIEFGTRHVVRVRLLP